MFAELATDPAEIVWLVVGVGLGAAEVLHTRGALAANAHLPIGAFAVVAGKALLRQTLPLPLPASHLTRGPDGLAHVHAQLRRAAAVDDAGAAAVPFAYAFASPK